MGALNQTPEAVAGSGPSQTHAAPASAPRPTWVKRLRKTVVWVTIVSFGLAAIGGITVLLSGNLDDTAARVIATTAIIGAFSVAVLCGAALITRPLQWVGLIGIAVSFVTATLTLVAIWSDTSLSDTFYKTLWTGLLFTAAFSLTSLLLLLADRKRRVITVSLWATLTFFVLVVGITFPLIWEASVDDEIYPRVLGIACILAALGVVIVPVMSMLLPDEKVARQATTDISPKTAEALLQAAAQRGITVEELVAPLLAAPVLTHSELPIPPRPQI